MPTRDQKERRATRPSRPAARARVAPTPQAAVSRPDGGPPGPSSHRALERLAEALHAKASDPSSDLRVVAFVGAGPSSVAGLPLGAELRNALKKEFLGKGGTEIHSVLDEEVAAFVDRHNRHTGVGSPFERLTLFEFAAVLAKFAYGQSVLRTAVERELGNPDHRPLAYELLAHLVKHRYVDHLVVLNFDTLLDDAVEDELPERARIIASAQDLPSEATLAEIEQTKPCFLVHPFGIVGRGAYSIAEADVVQFEQNIRRFLERQVIGAAATDQHLLLLLLGYSGAEPAFESLLSSYVKSARARHGTDRIQIVAIDPNGVPPPLEDVRRRVGLKDSVDHVPLEADAALEILVGMLAHHWRGKYPVGIPAARHKLVARSFGRAALDPDRRFRLELLLQAIKSRGFVHLTGLSDLKRLTRYADRDKVHEVLGDLLKRELLVRDRWIDPDGKEHVEQDANYVPNYMLGAFEKVVTEITRIWEPRRDDVTQVASWSVRPQGQGFTVQSTVTDSRDYLHDRLKEIEAAPDIEVAQPSGRDETWFLGPRAERLWSVGELTQRTVEMLNKALRYRGPVTIRGIWATGEWLFGANDGDSRTQPGWAVDQKAMLVDRLEGRGRGGPVTLEVIVSRAGGEPGLRAQRRSESIQRIWGIRKRIDPAARVHLRWENWWDMNRVLTLVAYDDHTEAIYMRRRLSQPLVTPYFVRFPPGTKYLTELWERYWARAKDVTEADVRRLEAIYGRTGASPR